MTDQPKESQESLITFPCDFTLKVFGLNSEQFEVTVLQLIHQHAPNLSDREIKSRLSENGKYLALSVTIHVDSKEQLDRIYRELTSSPQVMMVL